MLLFITPYTVFMQMNMAVAETIRALRKQKGVSQEKLADAIDSHQVYISEIEKGEKIPSLTILNNIATFFDISLTALIRKIEEKIDYKR